MGRPNITIYDIAYRAGVSQATVSRVLTGNARVRPDKRDAVLAAVKELNYRPNVVAQGLARGRTRAVGVLTSSTESLYWGRIIHGIERELGQAGYRSLVVSVAGTGDAEGALDVLLESQIEGLAVLGGPMPERIRQLAGENFPVAGIGQIIPGLEDAYVIPDNRGGGYMATRHLLDLGHRRIALITGPTTHHHAIQRREGYERALREAGLTTDEILIVHRGFNEAAGAEAARDLLARTRDFTAIFATSDQIAYGVRLALYQHGLRVPEDVSLVGFDDQLYAQYCIPPLTTIRQQTFEMGAAVARMIVSRIDEQQTPWNPDVFQGELVVRESTAPPRA